MTALFEAEQVIFDIARKLPSGASREAYLSQACGDNAALQRRVQELLGAFDESGTFLQAPPPGLGMHQATNYSVAERAGTEIGPYKLVEEIGVGGMGVVFRAEQSHPVERQVALKIIKPGMDTQQVLARFEAERQQQPPRHRRPAQCRSLRP